MTKELALELYRLMLAIRNENNSETQIITLIDKYQAHGGDLNYCPASTKIFIADEYDISFTILGEAICENRKSVIKHLVNQGANLLLVDATNISPMTLAIDEGSEAATIALLAQLLSEYLPYKQSSSILQNALNYCVKMRTNTNDPQITRDLTAIIKQLSLIAGNITLKRLRDTSEQENTAAPARKKEKSSTDQPTATTLEKETEPQPMPTP